MKTRLLLVLAVAAVSFSAVRCGSPSDAPDTGAAPGLDAATPAPGPDAETIVPPDAGLAAALPPGPDASSQDSGPPACDPSRCNPGNVCAGGQCRLSCARHVECPQGFDCRNVEEQLVCVENGLPYGTGQFGYNCGTGAPCAAGFRCVGPTGTPYAYCTLTNCDDDSDCPGNYWCATIEVPAATDGGTPDTGPKPDAAWEVPVTVPLSLCLKRGFCAPATGLVDCNDEDAVYARDYLGNGWCLAECDGSDPNGCGHGRGCIKKPSGYQCWPRALTCASSHDFCSRCLSVHDCPPNSFCTSTWLGEPYCTKLCSGSSECTWPNMPELANPGQCYEIAPGVGQCIAAPTIAPDGDEGARSCWKPLPGVDAGS